MKGPGRLSLKLGQSRDGRKLPQEFRHGNVPNVSEGESPGPSCSQPCSGLSNLGNTCYCNAVLQAVRHCPGFLVELERVHSSRQPCDERSIVHQLSRLMQEMEQSLQTVTPAAFVDVLRQSSAQFAGQAQHDAQELLNYLLAQSCLHTRRKRRAHSPLLEELPHKLFVTASGTSCRGPGSPSSGSAGLGSPDGLSIAALFQGRLAFQTRCFDCDNYTIKTEPFLHVSVPVTCPGLPGFPSPPSTSKGSTSAAPVSLSWCLSRFASRERLTWSNKFWCDCCGHLVEAERSILFSCLPQIMTVHLNRISMQGWGAAVGKVKGSVAVPLSLCLAPWSTQDCPSRGTVYWLQAVVLHSGASCHSGHYTAAVRAGDQWMHCNDENVHLLPDSALRDLLSPLPTSAASPYILFYCRH